MSLLEENQSTDLEKMVGLSRRGFISAGALTGAALFLGGGLLGRSALAEAVSANSQGRRMLQDDRENLELQRLLNETRKLVAERQKLLAEAKKLNRETNLYPLALVGGLVTAIAAVAGVFFKL